MPSRLHPPPQNWEVINLPLECNNFPEKSFPRTFTLRISLCVSFGYSQSWIWLQETYITGCHGTQLSVSLLDQEDDPSEAGHHVGWSCSSVPLGFCSFQSPVGQSESSSFCSDNLNLDFSFSRVIRPNRRSTSYGPRSLAWGGALAPYGICAPDLLPNGLTALGSSFCLSLPSAFPSLQSCSKAIKTCYEECWELL